MIGRQPLPRRITVRSYDQIDIAIVVAIAAALVVLSLALSVLALWRMEDRAVRSGLCWLFATNLAFLVGTGALLGREVLPFWLSAALVISGAHLGLLAGHAAILSGLGVQPRPRRMAAVAGLVIGGQAGLAATVGTVEVLFVSSSLANGTLAALLACDLWRRAQPLGRAQSCLATLPFAAISVAYLGRLPVLSLMDNPVAVLVSTLLIAFLLAFSAMQWCFALISFAAARLNRTLRAAHARAERAHVLKVQFLSTMSHELRTPLNGILGMAQALEATLPEGGARDMVRSLGRCGDDLLGLLGDILCLSDLEAGRMGATPAPFIPEALLHAAAARWRPRAEGKGLRLAVRAGPGLAHPVLGDRAILDRVLDHLLSNAVKFTAHGQVQLIAGAAARVGGTMLRLEVRDTGIGMTPAQQAEAFEPFVQADGGLNRRHGGAGLGLAIVQRLMALMGGEVRLDSAPDKGTRVALRLPLAKAPVMTQGTAPIPAAPPAPPADTAAGTGAPVATLAGLRVLLAEDNPTNQRIVAAFLRGTGAELTIVDNGRLAVERLRAEGQPARAAYDLLLFDMAMPEMDGSTALRQIHAAAHPDHPAPPAIVLTANVEAGQIDSYREAGFAECLAKPVRRPDLLAAIARNARRRTPAAAAPRIDDG